MNNYLASILATLLVASPLIAGAQSEAIKTAREDITNAETPADTLGKVVALAAIETDDLIAKLTALKPANTAHKEIIASFLTTLNTYHTYYASTTTTLAATTTNVAELATTFKTWWDGTYKPHNKQVVDFLLLLKGQEAIAIADARLTKITTSFTTFTDSRIASSTTLASYLTDAKNAIEKARTLVANAEDSFVHTVVTPSLLIASSTDSTATTTDTTLLSASSSLSSMLIVSTNTPNDTASTTATDILIVTPPIDIRPLLSDSVTALKNAYQNFIDMSLLINKILAEPAPLPKAE